MGSILSEAAANFDNLSVDELKAHLIKVAEQRQKQRAHQQEYNASPEAKAKRKTYQTSRLEAIKADPTKYDALKAKRKEYMNRPDVKSKRQAYHKTRNEVMKKLMEVAKAKGIDVDSLLKQTA
jgi:hypothetical protein